MKLELFGATLCINANPKCTDIDKVNQMIELFHNEIGLGARVEVDDVEYGEFHVTANYDEFYTHEEIRDIYKKLKKMVK